MGCVRRSLAESARGLPRGGCFRGFFKRHLAEGERSDAIETAQQAFRIPRRAVEVSEGFGLRRLVQCQDQLVAVGPSGSDTILAAIEPEIVD